jgi:hypothetical protein
MKVTEKLFKQLAEEGKIKGYSVTGCQNTKYIAEIEVLPVKVKKGAEIKYWLHDTLLTWVVKQGNVYMMSEYKFHPTRKWRFDFAVFHWNGDKLCAIEYEGLNSRKSRHTTITGYTGDTEKYNAAQLEGWKVLRYTALNYKNVLNDLNNLIKI